MEHEWLTMLDKIPAGHFPMWATLPDVVADWNATVVLAHRYLPELKRRGLGTCLVLQDGCCWEEARRLDTDAVFVGGSDAWKEANVVKARTVFADRWVHVGRVNTKHRLLLCVRAKVDSVDGTTLNRFTDASIAKFERWLAVPVPGQGALEF